MYVSTLMAGLAKLDPHYLLEKNRVGNLVILNQDGHYLGYVDLRTGEVDLEEEQDET